MLETLPYDPELAQKAREYILELNLWLEDRNVDPRLILEMQTYLNNLITLHAARTKALEASVSGLG